MTAEQKSNGIKVAAIQMISTPDIATNLASARRLVTQAAADGAQLVVLPEYFFLITRDEQAKVAACEIPGQGPLQDFLAGLARELGIWLVGGSLPLQASDAQHMRNSCLVWNPQGEQVARYDKMHLFGFDNGSERYDEAATIEAGDTPVTFDGPAGKTGLAICYDLRFPEYFRALGEVNLLILPAAFTATTGQAHWEVLLRARAIENQCYVLASAQGGEHPTGRRTFGHSMLIDPWGEILSCLPDGEGIVGGVIDPQRLHTVRHSLPALRHRRHWLV